MNKNQYYLPEKFESIVISMNNLYPNLVLGGSLALELQGYNMGKRKNRDLDYIMTSLLTETQVGTLKLLLGFKIYYIDDDSYFGNSYVSIENIKSSMKHIILKNTKYKIDVFNKKDRKSILVKYVDRKGKKHNLRVSPPNFILKAKFKYLFNNPFESKKHLKDIFKILFKKKTNAVA